MFLRVKYAIRVLHEIRAVKLRGFAAGRSKSSGITCCEGVRQGVKLKCGRKRARIKTDS